MYSPLLILCLVPSLSVPIPLEPGTELEYRGNFVAERGDASASEKVFRLRLLVSESDSEGLVAYWTLDEERHGSWSWLNHFGRTRLPRSVRDVDTSEPSLLYIREEGSSVVPVLFPLLQPKLELGLDTKWFEGRLEYEVEEAVKLGDKDAWKIAVGNAYGRKRTLWVDQRNHMILAAEESVFIGQGEKHRLRFALISHAAVPVDRLNAAQASFESLIQLRRKLGISPRARDVKWSDENLELLAEQLPKLHNQARATKSLANVIQAATRETRRQRNRLGALASVKDRLIGKTAPKPEVTDLEGAKFDWSQLKNAVTVLHFWEYRDTPLEEPYGQIAYVDFLHRNHDSERVRVFGISVDDRLADPGTHGQAVRSVRKLRSFMNLSYPQLLDAGAAIQQYGDPRVTGAKLPLFVVIDRSGKIVHYHVGAYEIDKDRGLKVLDEVVNRALGSRG